MEPRATSIAGSRKEAFDRYVLPEVEVLLRVARTLVGRPADAEDLVQDTLLRAFQAIGSFALPAALASLGLDAVARDSDGDHHRGRAVPAG